jgi:hypothetical protein
MNPFQLLLRGVIAGLAISAPVGPVNVLCISRTISKGRTAGLVSGLGAAAADTIYGAIAGFSISFVIRFLIDEEFWIRLGGRHSSHWYRHYVLPKKATIFKRAEQRIGTF